MSQRLAITAAGVAATIVLTVGLAAAGFVPVPQTGGSADAGLDDSTAAAQAASDPAPEPEIVYVKPAPTPGTIVLKKQAKAAKSASSGTRPRVARVGRERDDEAADERREKEREDAAERRKKAAERAKERREEEREGDDD